MMKKTKVQMKNITMTKLKVQGVQMHILVILFGKFKNSTSFFSSVIFWTNSDRSMATVAY